MRSPDSSDVAPGGRLEGTPVIVTGGAGFIGSHVVDALLAVGAKVTVLDDLSSGQPHRLDASVDLVQGDIRDASTTDRLFAKIRPSAVLHLAAQVSVPESVRDPATDAAINVLGTVNVVNASVQSGARVLVNTSSGGAVYGDGPVPAAETAPDRPISPYGASKRAGELYVELAGLQRPLRTVSLRLANVYGPRQDDRGEAGVVAVFVTRALAGSPIEIHGDGRQTRDFVHARDVARAQVRALVAPVTGAVNVGTGEARSILELADVVQTVTGLPLHRETREAREGDVRHSRLDVTRAREVLGFVPQVALADGIAETVTYWTSQDQALNPARG